MGIIIVAVSRSGIPNQAGAPILNTSSPQLSRMIVDIMLETKYKETSGLKAVEIAHKDKRFFNE